MMESVTHLVTKFEDLVIVCRVSIDHDGVCISIYDVKVELLYEVAGVEQDLPPLACNNSL
jgi:hypothetical protein